MRYYITCKWFFASIALVIASFSVKVSAENYAARGALAIARDVGEVDGEQVQGPGALSAAKTFAQTSDALRTVSVWLLVAGVTVLLISAVTREPVKQFWALPFLCVAGVMQFLIV